MKNNLRVKLNIIIFSILIILLFCSNAIGDSFFNLYPAKDINDDTIIVTGDSYAGYFATYECYKDYNILIYAEAGKSTKENYEIMKTAVGLYPKTIIISVGVNDHNKNEPPSDFRNRIENLVKLCRLYNKKVILHTYMNYETDAFKEENEEKQYDVSDYDNILKDVGAKNNNAFYIDMSDYNKKEYLQDDKIHYNKVFYDELYNRISTAMMLF